MTDKLQTLAEQIKAKEGPQYRVLKTCKGCCHFKSEYWREPSGDGETYDSGTYADCLKAGRNICSNYGDEPSPPDWCPCAALEPDPTPALGWKAMQTAAVKAVAKEAHGETALGGQRFKTVKLEDAVDAILVLPGPTADQLLADAVRLPEVQAVVEVTKRLNAACDAMWNDTSRLEKTPGFFGQPFQIKYKHMKAISEAQQALFAALAKIGGAA